MTEETVYHKMVVDYLTEFVEQTLDTSGASNDRAFLARLARRIEEKTPAHYVLFTQIDKKVPTMLAQRLSGESNGITAESLVGRIKKHYACFGNRSDPTSC